MKKEKQKKEIVKEESNIKKEEKRVDNQENKYHKYLSYFTIFSIIGLLLEVISCFVIGKIFKKDFGLILGPLCLIYGLGANIVIILLDRFKENKFKLFILGAILCTAIEYLISFILESIFGAKFGDCAWARFNINGRVCLEHAILWGILTVITVVIFKKYIDLLINKIKGKSRIAIDIILTVLILITIILAVWGAGTYSVRAKEVLNGKNYISNNNIIEKFQNTVFSNEIMEKIFSNMQIIDNEGNWILIKNING